MLFTAYFRALSAGKKTALLAVLAALSVVVNCFSVDVGASNKIAFTYAVCFAAGVLTGGVPAFFVALLGDALGYLFNPVGVYWLYGLTLGIFALLMGVIANMPLGKGRAAPYARAAAALLAGFLLVTVLLNSAVNYLYLKTFVWNGAANKTFLVYLGGRLAFQSIVYAVNTALCFLLLPVLLRFGRRKKARPQAADGAKDGAESRLKDHVKNI